MYTVSAAREGSCRVHAVQIQSILTTHSTLTLQIVEHTRYSRSSQRMATTVLRILLATFCVLSLGGPWVGVKAVPLSDFYSFGAEHGDAILPPGDDASAVLELKKPILFYGQPRWLITVRWSAAVVRLSLPGELSTLGALARDGEGK